MAERNMLRAMVDAIPDLVFVKDTQGRFVVANMAVAQSFGLASPAELIGKSDFDFFPAETVMHIHEDEQAIVRSGQPHLDHQEPNNVLVGGKPRWFSTSKIPLFDAEGRVTALVGCCREMTAHRLYELDLERRNAELASLNAALSEAQKQLVRSEKMAALGSLVAGIAHELNTPIGIGVTAASTLHEQTQELLKEMEHEGLRRSVLNRYLFGVAEGTHLLLHALTSASNLVLSFKQVAVDQASSQRRCFDLRHALEDIVAMLGPLYKKMPFTLSLDLANGIVLDSYPGPLGQVVNNLISNALMHAFGGRCSGNMHLSTALLDAQHVEIRFSDDGVGIPEKNLARVFDPFFTTRLGQGGSGLGLHIAYNIVTDILGGNIDLQSEMDCGTTVIMKLPLIAPLCAARGA
ncbi:MAG: PAS domain-containing sensor histidine kinase [Rhodoferax sp.]|nr:PAS domain-containing sensor histidine kinase [Rhodoferax sp.]MDP3653148.1 PAS domain-containing sensor histidine kinase [Rhodoferax sp.]